MKKEKIQSLIPVVENDTSQFLSFLKSRYPIFHNSNFFRKDLQYGIKRFFETKEIEINLADAEALSDKLAQSFELKGIFIRTNKIGWKINYPQFVTVNPGDPL